MSIAMSETAVVGRVVGPCAVPVAARPGKKARTMPASAKRIAANRRNAKRSTGPTTDVGKNVSRMNAVTHGCCAQHPVLPTEDRGAFDMFQEELRDELRPRTVLEKVLFPRLVGLFWRLRRLDDAERHLFEKEAEKAPAAEGVPCRVLAERFAEDPANGFTLLGRYERGMHNLAMRMLGQYMRLRKSHESAPYDFDEPPVPKTRAWMSPAAREAIAQRLAEQDRMAEWVGRDEGRLEGDLNTEDTENVEGGEELCGDGRSGVEEKGVESREPLGVRNHPHLASPGVPGEGPEGGLASSTLPPGISSSEFCESSAISVPSVVDCSSAGAERSHFDRVNSTPPIVDHAFMSTPSIAAAETTKYASATGNPGKDSMIEKIFKAYDVRATYPSPLNEENAWKVGHATGQFLKRSRQNIAADVKVKREDTMIVGRDMRPHSPDLANALIDGIRSTGMNVIDVGMIDTSFIYFAINHLDAVGGIMVTASHNPVQYNGFKISGPKAKPIGSATGLDDIKRIASGLRVGTTGVKGAVSEMDLWTEYRAHVLQFLDLKRKVRVVVDASNGMAGKMVPPVFSNIPNLEIIPMLFEITGSFVHDPNPLVDSNMDMLKAKVKETGADLGGCFDGDADRCFFVDEKGQTIGCDILTALMAKDFLLETPGATIVYDLRSSHVVPDEIRAAGGVPKRDRVGHAFIKKTMAEQKAVFGGELSGHFYFQGNFYADSGAIAFAKVLSVLSKGTGTASEQLKPLSKYFQTGEVNFHVEDKDAKIREIAEMYKAGTTDYLDGITVELQGWWFNVRKSNTEPMLRLNLEAATPALRDEKFKELKKMLGEPAEGH